MSKVAFITGISGMDGKLLSNFLLSKGYKIIGLVRKQSVHEVTVHSDIEYIIGDLLNIDLVLEKLQNIRIDEIYLLGAQSSIEPSWDNFLETYNINVTSTIKILDFVRKKVEKPKVFFASSSEIFGNPSEEPQNEKTEKSPRNPYGLSKILGQQIVEQYRNLYGLFCCSGILYNHESEFRKRDVVTTKIVKGVSKISKGSTEKIKIGNINSKRDWTSARDFVEGMWMTLQQEFPDDYIFSSNTIHSVEEMLKICFELIGITNYENFVIIDEELIRPTESLNLVGNNSKLKSIGWKPKIEFREMLNQMIKYEIEKIQI